MRIIIAILLLCLSGMTCHSTQCQPEYCVVNEEPSEMKMLVLSENKSLESQLACTNTIYEVRHIFHLDGKTVQIPKGCILRFNGGGFTDGTIKGDLTQIQGASANIFSTSLYLSGTWDINRIDVRWFGAIGDNTDVDKISRDDTKAINHALALSQIISTWQRNIPVYLAPATYKITAPIRIKYATQLIGDSPRNSLSMPPVRLLRYGTVKGDDESDCAVIIEDQARLENVYIELLTGNKVLDGINIEGTAGIDLNNIAIKNCHYGITKIFKKVGAGFTDSKLSEIRISDCVRGVNVTDNGSLPKKKSDIITWMNHVYFSRIEIDNVYECGMYFDLISSFDANIIDGISLANVGYGDYYPGHYFNSFTENYIAGVYASVFDDSHIGLLSIQKGYLENIYCTDRPPGRPRKGKYFIEGFDYDKNPCICVNNINLIVRDIHFQNTLELITSLGRDNILMESCTDSEYYRGSNDKQRIYICCENPNTTLHIQNVNFDNKQGKDCIKHNIFTGSIKSLKLQDIRYGIEHETLEDVDIEFYDGGFITSSSDLFVSEKCEGSGVWQTFPMDVEDLTQEIKIKNEITVHLVSDVTLSKSITIKGLATDTKSSFFLNLNHYSLICPQYTNSVLSVNDVKQLMIANGFIKIANRNETKNLQMVYLKGRTNGVEFSDLGLLGIGKKNDVKVALVNSENSNSEYKPIINCYGVNSSLSSCSLVYGGSFCEKGYIVNTKGIQIPSR